MLKFQIQRARDWYQKAEDGIPMLAPDAQLPIRASLDMYSTILNKIEDNDYDNFNKRAYTAKYSHPPYPPPLASIRSLCGVARSWHTACQRPTVPSRHPLHCRPQMVAIRHCTLTRAFPCSDASVESRPNALMCLCALSLCRWEKLAMLPRAYLRVNAPQIGL